MRTNIYCTGLIYCYGILGSANPILYIPWMVITELDYMKDGDHCKPDKLKNSITKSIKFINTCLKEKHPRVIGIFKKGSFFNIFGDFPLFQLKVFLTLKNKNKLEQAKMIRLFLAACKWQRNMKLW